MTSTCKACNITENGLFPLYSHPKEIDKIFTNLTKIEVNDNDHLCLSCYDELKSCNQFIEKCLKVHSSRNLCENLENEIDEVPKADEITARSPSPNSQDFSDGISLYEVLNLNDSKKDSSEQLDYESNEYTSIEIVPNHSDPEILEIDAIQVNIFSDSDNLQNQSYQSQIVKKKRGRKSNNDTNDNICETHFRQCQYCFAEFTKVSERKIHEIEHKNDPQPFKCYYENCSSQYKTKNGLILHIKTHLGLKENECKFCGAKFFQRTNLVIHERIHTGEKPFLCSYCGKNYSDLGNLRKHIRFHTGEKPFLCEICKKYFKTSYSHKVHMRTHTKEKPYQCSFCEKSFISSGKLLLHERLHTGAKPYKCSICSAAFNNCTAKKRHEKIHNKEKPAFNWSET